MTSEERSETPKGRESGAARQSYPLSIIGLILFGVAVGLLVVATVSTRDSWVIRGFGAPLLVLAVSGLFLLFLGCQPFAARLVTVGILLLGVASAVVAGAHAEGLFRRISAFDEDVTEWAAACAFVIAVTGLGGLVCMIVGFARLLRRST